MDPRSVFMDWFCLAKRTISDAARLSTLKRQHCILIVMTIEIMSSKTVKFQGRYGFVFGTGVDN